MYELHLSPTVYVYELVLHTHCVLRIWGPDEPVVFARWAPAQLLCVAVICKTNEPDDVRIPHLWNAP